MNPIFRRYCRSRLRPTGLGVSLLISLILSGFIFFLCRTIGIHQSELEIIDSERIAFIPLLIFQGVILFLLGTGQVAGGMTAESDEGVIEYQRLSPMRPLSKVLGYLFGLPVREYAMVIVTLPFTAWSVWRGGIALGAVFQLYAVFFSSAVLYHLTGLVAGTVVKNKRWAFLISMGVIFLLYTVIPQIAAFGMPYFKYLTMWPTIEEHLPKLIPRDSGAVLDIAKSFLDQPRFFNLSFPEAVFSIISQSVLIVTFIMMLWRRWSRAESHLLGKAWALGLYAWIQVLILGNVLPLINAGFAFPSREMSRRFRGSLRNWDRWEPETSEALAMSAMYGLFSLLLLWTLTLMVTPKKETQLRGWRRLRKLGKNRLAATSDAATAFPWVAGMAVAGIAGWFLFTRAVIESRWYPGMEMPAIALGSFALAFFAAGLGFQALIEGQTGRTVGLTAIFLGVVPLLVGAIIALSSNGLAAPATWLIGVSPMSSTFYAASATLPVADFPIDIERALPRAFWFWQGIGALVAITLLVKLRQSRKAIAKSTLGGSTLVEVPEKEAPR